MVEILACRMCLATDVKLFNMYKEGFVDLYEMLIGTEMTDSDGLPQEMCGSCSTALLKYSRFKERCSNAQALLKCILWNKIVITVDDVRSIDRKYHNLTLPFTCVSLQPIDIDNNSKIEVVHENCSTVIKTEKKDDCSDELAEKKSVSGPCKVKSDPFEIEQADYSDKADNNDLDRSLDNSDDEPLSKMVKFRNKKPKIKVSGKLDTAIDSLDPDEMVKRKKFRHGKSGKLCSLDNECDIVILTKEQQMEELLARKNSHNYLNSSYRCEFCYRGFLTKTTYLNHMLRHDPAVGEYACGVCGVRSASAVAAATHVRTAHQRYYVCQLCGEKAKSRHRAREHARWHRGHVYACSHCGDTFAKPTTLLTHVRTQHADSHTCSECGESFLSPAGLSAHTSRTHHVVRKVRSSEVEMESERATCGVCGAVFRGMSALQRHQAANQCRAGLRWCSECGESARSVAALRLHRRRLHATRIACPQCDKSFSTERTMESHRRLAHAAASTPADLRSTPAQNRAPVPGPAQCCEHCGLLCRSRTALAMHLRVHTGEKPFACTRCPKRFTTHQLLKIHVRVHTDERPYSCTSCPKSFRHKAALNRHARVHSGARPYACAHCHKAFTQSNSCKLHVRTVHLRLPGPPRTRPALLPREPELTDERQREMEQA